MSRSAWILLALALAIAAGAVVTLSSGTPQPGLVNDKQFQELQKSGVRIIDVRTPGEFSISHIAGAENVPLASFAAASSAWDPAEPIALYCASGSRSAEAAHILKSAGFEKVYDLSGGIIAWSGPVESGDQTTTAGQAQPTARPVMYEFYTDW